MRKHFYAVSLIGFLLFFNACVPRYRYVRKKPVYVERNKPNRPSDDHVWIDGWTWNARTKTYNQRDGYWVMPKRGRTYLPGHWQRDRIGSRWLSGRWQ